MRSTWTRWKWSTRWNAPCWKGPSSQLFPTASKFESVLESVVKRIPSKSSLLSLQYYLLTHYYIINISKNLCNYKRPNRIYFQQIPAVNSQKNFNFSGLVWDSLRNCCVHVRGHWKESLIAAANQLAGNRSWLKWLQVFNRRLWIENDRELDGEKSPSGLLPAITNSTRGKDVIIKWKRGVDEDFGCRLLLQKSMWINERRHRISNWAAGNKESLDGRWCVADDNKINLNQFTQ